MRWTLALRAECVAVYKEACYSSAGIRFLMFRGPVDTLRLPPVGCSLSRAGSKEGTAITRQPKGGMKGHAPFPSHTGSGTTSARQLKTEIGTIERRVKWLNKRAEEGLVLAIRTIDKVGDLIGCPANALHFRGQVVHEVSALIRPSNAVSVALPRISVVRSTPSPDAARVHHRGGEEGKRDDVACLERRRTWLLDSMGKHEKAIALLRVILENGTDFLERAMAGDMDWFAKWSRA